MSRLVRFLVVFPALQLVRAQSGTDQEWDWNHDTPIVGCKGLGCQNVTSEYRKGQNWDLANCTTGEDRLGAIGIVENVFDVPDNDVSLSLTVGRTPGNGWFGREHPDLALFTHNFYIGKPAGFDLTRPKSITAGCVLLWQDDFHAFDVQEGDPAQGGKTSSCGVGSGMDDCYKHMTKVFDAFRAGYKEDSSLMPLCEALAKNISETFRHDDNYYGTMNNQTGCSQYLGRSLFKINLGTNLTGVPLLGRDAPWDVVEGGNCHPTLPRENELVRLTSLVFMISNRYGRAAYENPLQEGIDGITPAMSVIFKEDNTTTVQSACIRIMDNPEGQPWSGSGRAMPGIWSVLLSLLLVFLIL